MLDSYETLFREAMLKVRPICCILELTERCQQNCRFCLKDKHQIGEMPASFWASLLPTLAEAGVFEIQFSGGEPLLYAGLPELVAEAKRLGFRLLVTTNGNHSTAGIEAWAKSIHKFRVSIHGPSDEVHDAIVGSQGAFHRAVELALATKQIGCQTTIVYVINGLNVGYIEESCRFFTGLGLEFSASPLLLSNVATGTLDPACSLSDAQLLEAARTLERLNLAIPKRRPDEGWLCNAARNTFSVGTIASFAPAKSGI